MECYSRGHRMNRIAHIAERVAGGVLDSEALAKQADLQDFRKSIQFLETEGKRLDKGDALENILGGEKFSWMTRQQVLNIIDLMEIHEGDSDFVVPKNLHHFFEGYRLKFLARSKIPGDLPTEQFPTNFTPEYVINKVAGILDYPHRTQSFAYDCGATAVLTVLQYYGFNEDMINEQGVFDAIGTDINGTDNEGIESGIVKLGLKYERVMTLEDIDRHVEAGRPVLVSVAQWIENGVPVWHYEVVTARDGDHYIIADPWAVNLVWVPRDVFEKIWYEPHDVDVRRWGIGVYGEAKYHEVIAPMDYKLARISARVSDKALRLSGIFLGHTTSDRILGLVDDNYEVESRKGDFRKNHHSFSWNLSMRRGNHWYYDCDDKMVFMWGRFTKQTKDAIEMHLKEKYGVSVTDWTDIGDE